MPLQIRARATSKPFTNPYTLQHPDHGRFSAATAPEKPGLEPTLKIGQSPRVNGREAKVVQIIEEAWRAYKEEGVRPFATPQRIAMNGALGPAWVSGKSEPARLHP